MGEYHSLGFMKISQSQLSKSAVFIVPASSTAFIYIERHYIDIVIYKYIYNANGQSRSGGGIMPRLCILQKSL